ncbi:DUF3152 domain-containing protein [Streptomyces sp. NBC_01498]|uniref:DUF3152 domain-containing protein n=1 Tax=Streptomyces sp. NBC_01498 TaxID=2975870 RepID=UPI003FCCA3DE
MARTPSSQTDTSVRPRNPFPASGQIRARPRAHRAHRRHGGTTAVIALVALGSASVHLALGREAPGPADRLFPPSTGEPRDSRAPGSTDPALTVTPVPPSGPGPGTFTVAVSGAERVGAGRPYRVEVEDGTGVSPDETAERIAAVLDDERGWAHGGDITFRQVADESATLVIRVATPHTAHRRPHLRDRRPRHRR